MHPIFYTLLLLVPSTLAAVDCRSACHACHAKDQAKQILEIYCAMCQECKECRKERIKSKIQLGHQLTSTTTEKITIPTGKIVQLQLPDNIYGDPPGIDSFERPEITAYNVVQDIPPGCPTAPPCSDDEAPITRPSTMRTTTTRTTTTRTTTPRPTCPPIKPCKKKKKDPIFIPLPPPLPCMPCCPMPPCAAPCFPYLPPGPYSYQPPGPYSYPPPSPPYSLPSYIPHTGPITPPSMPAPAPHTSSPAVEHSKSDADYVYMYVGVPKNMIRRNG